MQSQNNFQYKSKTDEQTSLMESGMMRQYFRSKEVTSNAKLYLRLIILTIIINLLFLITAFGQLIDVKNVTVTNSSVITVKGDFKSNAGAVISNSGTIEVAGDWTNNSSMNCFGSAQGTVVMNGLNQHLGGAYTTHFNNLTLTGGGTATLDNDIFVGGANIPATGILQLNNSVVDLNSKTLYITNPDGTALTSTTGYILSEQIDNSSAVKWIMNTITGIHTIPFGTINGDLIPFNFNLLSGDAGEVTVSTYPTAADNLPLPVSPVAVTHVRNGSGSDNSANTVDRFWQVDASKSPVATLTFTYAPSENASNGNTNMIAQRWNPSHDGWDLPFSGQFNPTSQSTTVSNVNTYGAWTLSQQSSPLPVELLFFNAKAISNNEVKCTWSTASEKDNDFYTVERSKDGYHFEAAGIVDGNGTTNDMSEYTFNDMNPYSGVSYYRLKQTDFNGDYTNSKVVAVNINEAGISMQVYPNPAADFIQIVTESSSAAELTLTDPAGKVVKKIHHDQFTTIDISDLAAGIYFLVAASDDGKVNNTFRIKKI